MYSMRRCLRGGVLDRTITRFPYCRTHNDINTNNNDINNNNYYYVC